MFNVTIPLPDELPSSKQLRRSSMAAMLSALVMFVTIVLPAEYGIDPTRIGRLLGLSQMGEMKQKLAGHAHVPERQDVPAMAQRPMDMLLAAAALVLPRPAAAQQSSGLAQSSSRSDETIITLQPNEGVEYKMALPRGAKVQYSWRSEGGPANYDMHGTPMGGGRETSYKSARGVASDEGMLTAGFDGTHGWFWRNRGTREIKITLKTSGPYEEIRRVR